jgi:transposase IS116/IS110/IS902 family protein
MGMLADRRDELGRARTQVTGRLHRLLLELLPGGAKKFLSARQARALLATVRPRDLAGKTRRRLAAELESIDKKARAIDKELTALVTARGSTLMGLHGIGPSGAARLLADAGGIHRSASRDRFASRNGTAPLDASSGSQARHRLSPCREPAHQPGPAHHGGRAAAEPDQGPRPLRPAPGRRDALDDGHARPQAAAVQRRLRPHARRPETTRSGPGRAIGDAC